MKPAARPFPATPFQAPARAKEVPMRFTAAPRATRSRRALRPLAVLALLAASLAPATSRAQCTFTVSPTAAEVPASGAIGLSFTVTTDPLCAWNIATADQWIVNLSQSAGGGPGIVTFDVLPNLDLDGTRVGAILVADTDFTVTQASPDWEPLLDLYAFTNGPGWTVSTGWGGPMGTECSWYGITCNAGRVSQVALAGNNLVGTIPPSLGAMTFLEALYLNSNNLSGSIPFELGGLSFLNTLQLFQNGLSGSIPPTLGNCFGLVSIDVSRNLLTGPVPTELGNLYSLSSLWLYSNALEGPLPTSLTNLSELTWMSLSYNALFSTDAGLTAFLDARQPGWQDSQTVAPAGVSAAGTGGTTVQVSWAPIAYSADPGYYEVLASTIPGNWASVGTTTDKSTASLTVPAQPLWPTDFKVRTVTLPHPSNTNTVTSGDSAVAQASTLPCNYSLSTDTAAFDSTGGPGQTFDVAALADCGWNAGTSETWITVTGGATGSGNGTVTYSVAANAGPGRSGMISVTGITNPVGLGFTVDQADGCADNAALSPPGSSPPSSGATGQTFDVLIAGDCEWNAASNDPWIIVTGGATGVGSATVTYDVASNAGPSRVGTITAAGRTFSVSQGDGCASSTSLDPASANLPPEGAMGQVFNVLAADECAWTATPNATWITVTGGATGIGIGAVTYDVDPNAGPARVGTITAAGQTFTVSQADGCLSGTALVPAFTSIPPEGAVARSFQLQTSGTCAWTAASDVPWITVTSGSSGTGNGSVTFDVAPNAGAARTGTISASGLAFQVEQAENCDATTSLQPSSASVPTSGTAGLSFQIVTGASCFWTAVADVPWIEVLSGGSGAGNASVTYRVAPNAGPARTGTMTVAGRTFTVSQENGCTAGSTISPSSIDLPATAAGDLSFQVSTDAGCPWTATAGAPWIVVTGGATGTGPGTVTFRAEPNGPLPRTGTIAAAGKTFVVRQASDCVAPESPRFTSYPTAHVVAGSTFTVAWAPVANLSSTGFYEVRLSRNRDCSAPETLLTEGTSVSVVTDDGVAAEYCTQVVALAGAACPPELVSPPSEPLVVEARPLPPSFTVLQPMSPSARANRNEAPPTGSTVVFRNVGDSAGTLELSTLGGSFSTDPGGPLEVPAGSDAAVRIVFAPESTATAGVKQGDLVGTWDTTDGRKSVSADVTLTVFEASSPSTNGMRLEPVGSDRVYFRQVEGNPDPQEIAIRNTGSLPVRIAPAIGPGGSWLSVSGDFASPVPPGTLRTFQLSVDRSRRTSDDGPPPLSTGLGIENVDGNPEDAARFEAFDEEPLPPGPGTDRPEQKEEEFSLILGSSVSTTTTDPSARAIAHTGAEYLSDGWIRNRGSDEVSVDLYYSPGGVNGIDDPRVRKNTVVLAAYGSYRMSDFVKGLFGETGSGHVEIRSAQLPQLSIRSTVDSLSRRDGAPAQYGAELPLFVSGEGVRLATGTQTPRVAVLAGLKGPLAGFRSNVIFAETLGRWTDVTAILYDAGGRRLGGKTLRVEPYSKVQVNYDDPDLFAAPYAEASLELAATAGEGAVAALATVLDNASECYVVRVAAVLERPAAARGAARAALAAASSVAWVPTATRRASTDSFYTTDLSVTNETDADAALQVTFLPEAGLGDPVGPKPLLVPRRDPDGGPKIVAISDVLKTLLGVEGNSRGMLRFEGPLAQLVFSSETSTPIDPEKPELGRSLSSLSPAPGVTTKFLGVFSKDSQEAVGIKLSASDPVKQEVSYPSIEEGADYRTDLVLAELAGEPAKLRIKLRKTGGAALGAPLVVSLAPNQRMQIDSVILAVTKPPAGVVEFKGLEIAVEAFEGKGRTVALVTRVSKDPASKRADSWVLGPAVSGSASRGGKK